MCRWHTFLSVALAAAKITPPFYRLYQQSSTIPKSTIQISPGSGSESVGTEGILPLFALVGGGEEASGGGGNGNGEIFLDFDLGEEDVDGVAGLHAEFGKNLFRIAEAGGGNTGAEKGGGCHGSNVLKKPQWSREGS